MTTTDPIADMLTRIRNANMVRRDFVLVPASRMNLAITKTLKIERFISNYELLRDKSQRVIKIQLKYTDKGQPVILGLKRLSTPGLRVYVQRSEIPRVYGGLGITIVSTSRGVMTGQQAWRQNLGGELLCSVW